MIPRYTIRGLRDDDLSHLAELERHAFDEPWSRQALSSQLAKPTTRGWLLEDPEHTDDLAAYTLFQVVADEAELLRIAVHPARRRQGLGHRLLAHSLDHLATRGITTCHLEVRADNHAAQALYQRLGFRRTGKRPAYYRDGCNAVLFVISLAQRRAQSF